METFLRSALLVGLAFLLLVVQSTFAVLYSIHPFEPNLLLPIVIFLGVAQDVQIVRGMVVSFLVGYVFDLFTGNPLSLQTFLMTGGFLVARFAGLRFVLRGPSFRPCSPSSRASSQGRSRSRSAASSTRPCPSRSRARSRPSSRSSARRRRRP